jgi:hypothetical protein
MGLGQVKVVRVALCAEDRIGAENVRIVFGAIVEAQRSPLQVEWVGEAGALFRKSRRARAGNKTFGSGPRELGAWKTRPAVKVARNDWFLCREGSDAVVVATDIDRNPERGLSSEERQDFIKLVPPLILAEMNPEAEAWRIVVSAQHPNMRAVRQSLSFDPSREPERMTSTAGGQRDCKTVFRNLFGADEPSSLIGFGHGIDALKSSPQVSGLPQFVADVEGLLSVLTPV